ncbi:hypothetical protein FZC78_14185 [Rossellomorea vietnamensis]|uniref:Uncharacterized protein n=1 Tax=Rossellomorea vietnamensis TaxID=218284 RepID=A0A5D4NN74_9BACI|nr:hypothetical protein FZC78_14185 [Rossellomorea vietnamensis]
MGWDKAAPYPTTIFAKRAFYFYKLLFFGLHYPRPAAPSPSGSNNLKRIKGKTAFFSFENICLLGLKEALPLLFLTALIDPSSRACFLYSMVKKACRQLLLSEQTESM